MSGFIPLLAKEFLEIRRTWRLWVVPGFLAFFAVTGPIMALLTPRLLASMAAQQPGVVITVPDPTAVDAYAQFVKGLMQMVLLALIIGGGGLVSGERASGTAIMVLTKPVSRAAFILSKLVAELVLLLVATMLTTVVTLLVTRALFPPVPAAPLFTAVAIWLVHAGLVVSAMVFFSASFRSRGGAAGAGLAFVMVLLLLSMWPAAERYSFVGLSAAIANALRGGDLWWGWPVGTAMVGMVGFAVAAVVVFRGKEI
ncbi:MAG: ABC transporter permease [Gemmatimonadetes bacterium]|nr:ABC transporter permease [Gemmatimonadota bacterium]